MPALSVIYRYFTSGWLLRRQSYLHYGRVPLADPFVVRKKLPYSSGFDWGKELDLVLGVYCCCTYFVSSCVCTEYDAKYHHHRVIERINKHGGREFDEPTKRATDLQAGGQQPSVPFLKLSVC